MEFIAAVPFSVVTKYIIWLIPDLPPVFLDKLAVKISNY